MIVETRNLAAAGDSSCGGGEPPGREDLLALSRLVRSVAIGKFAIPPIDIEETVQEVLLRVLRAGVNSPYPEAFVVTITGNVCLEYWRSKGRVSGSSDEATAERFERVMMTTRVLYRIAAVLILLFDLGHSAGFPWSDPKWGVDTGAMRSSHFPILGYSRTYWDFYVGFGLTISVFLLLTAILAWQLGNQTLPLLRGTAWALALAFAAMTVLNWMYFFTIPIVFSGLITVCLAAAAWRSSQST